MRFLHICFDSRRKLLFASDIHGLIAAYDQDLRNVVRSSNAGRSPLYVMVADQDYLYTRDIFGKVMKVNKDTLATESIYDLNVHTAPEMASVPTATHGLFLWNNHIYVVDCVGALQCLDLELNHVSSSPMQFKAFLEDVCHELENHYAVDCAGYLYRGHLQKDSWELLRRIDHGATHRILYDKLWDRFWITTDHNTGVALVDREGNVQKRLHFTVDDVEWISYDPIGNRMYIACFDHYLHVFENWETPTEAHKIGPFKFQLKQVIYRDDDHIYVLLESGEIYLCSSSEILGLAPGSGSDCFWDLKRNPSHPDLFLAALESGGIAFLRWNGKVLNLEKELSFASFGRVRRVVPLDDGGAIAGTSSGAIVRIDRDGNIVWNSNSNGIVRDLALSSDGRAVFSGNEAGQVWALNSETGAIRWSTQFAKPIWAIAICDDILYVAERALAREAEDLAGRRGIGDLIAMRTQDGERIFNRSFAGNIKRIKPDADGLLICGNGEVAAQRVSKDGFKTENKWEKWQLNTCEDVHLSAKRVFTITYGYQLNEYGINGEIHSSALPFSNYPKVICSLDESQFFVAGRDRFVKLFETTGEETREVDAWYL